MSSLFWTGKYFTGVVEVVDDKTVKHYPWWPEGPTREYDLDFEEQGRYHRAIKHGDIMPFCADPDLQVDLGL